MTAVSYVIAPVIYTCTYTNLKFTAIFSSFAYVTIKDRLPVILAKIADTVFRSKTWVKEDYGQVGCLVNGIAPVKKE